MSKTLTAALDAINRQYGKTLRAVLYLRVSTEEQVKGYGLSDGEKKCRAYAEGNGWDIVDIYQDPGVSGKLQAADRPDLKRLMQDAAKGAFDVVVVSEARVIGRTDRAYYSWVWDLEDRGIFVADARTGLDNTTEEGREAMREEANYAFKEYTRIKNRTQNGIQEKALAGLLTGGRPKFGYRIKFKGQKGLSHQVLDLCDGEEACRYMDGECTTKHEADTLKIGRRLVIQNDGDFDLTARTLNAEGRCRRNGKPWTGGDLRIVMMRDDLHDAVVHFRKAGRTTQPQREGVTIQLERLWTPEEVKELKAAAKPRRRRSEPARELMLSARIQSLCGNHYVIRNRHYMCRGRTHRNTCECPAIMGRNLDGMVWEKVRAILGDADNLKALAEEWVGLTAGNRGNYLQRIAELDQRIEELQDTIDLTMSSAAASAARRKLSREEAEKAVERALRPLEKELLDLEVQRKEVAVWQAESAAAGERAGQLQALAATARHRLDDFTPAQRAEFIGLLNIQLQVLGQRSEPSTRSKIVMPPMTITGDLGALGSIGDTGSVFSWVGPACVIGRFSMNLAA